MAPVPASAARRAPREIWLLRVLLLLGAFALACAAAAQQAAAGSGDPPGRVARLNHVEGALSYAREGGTQWTAAPYNRPLTDGDRLWTAERARAEIDTGNALLRMNGDTSLVLSEIDDQTVRLQLTQGALGFRISGLYEGDRFEIDTPQLAFVADRAGEYRIDVDAQRGQTEVAVLSGTATLYGERGESVEVLSGQRLAFEGRQLNPVPGYHSAGADAFDHWVAARNRIADQSVAARYASSGIVGLSQLDQYGSWQEDRSYGPVWYPGGVAADWAPYRFGQWSYIEPWGWTWIDDAPWGFAPFHYGRWVQVGSRWGWTPGPVQRRVWYAPALVGFGGAGNDVHWHPGTKPGGASSWFPLAPGEPWRPGWRASQRYIDNVNRGIHQHHHGDRRGPGRYVYAAQPGAITSIDHGRWEPGRPVRVGRPGAGGFEPPTAPFAPPPSREHIKPWPVREQLPRDPLRNASNGGEDGWRGPRHHGRGGDASAVPLRPAPALPSQPQLPIQRQVQNDWQRYQQQEAQRQWNDSQRNIAEQEYFRRQQQETFQRQQQERMRQEQYRREQQQYQWQRQQQQQQQWQQQQRAQQEQMRQRQDQMRDQMQQRQMQQRATREMEMYQQQEQRAQQLREQQMRGQVPP